jgi:methylated-DNA-[protein]-cysteine S-methyltransferase
MFSQTIGTPLGPVTIEADETALTRVSFGNNSNQSPNSITRMTAGQLDEYFDGKRLQFEIPMRITGTDFQRRVWKELLDIPAGKTSSYGQIAKNIGKPKAARAVGGAVGSNPFAIVIPCHRVMASNGAITGYTGGDGIKTKRKLLDLESLG